MKTVVVLSAVILAAALAAVFLRGHGGREEPRRRVTIAVSADPSSSLVFIAQAAGLFRKEGLDVTLSMHTSGKSALREMMEGRADFSTIADTVLMFAALEGKEIATVATIAESDRNHRVVALRDRGIVRPDQLAGRRIGVTMRTSGEYFLYTLLIFQGIDPAGVTWVNLAPEEMERALRKGRVDAVATWLPTAGKIAEAFGPRAVSFEEHAFLMGWNVVGRRPYLHQHPMTVRKLVRSLILARKVMAGRKEESIAITARFSGLDPNLLTRNWSSYTFDVGLREIEVTNLEEQARWAIGRYFPRRTKSPDFSAFFYPEALLAEDPNAVSVLTELVQ